MHGRCYILRTISLSDISTSDVRMHSCFRRNLERALQIDLASGGTVWPFALGGVMVEQESPRVILENPQLADQVGR